MSRKSRTKAKEKRRADKAYRKEQQRSLYEGFMKTGKNTKSKRSIKSGKKNSVNGISHPEGRCGNPGCIKCFSINYTSFLFRGQPKSMPQWMWARWDGLTKEERKKIRAQ